MPFKSVGKGFLMKSDKKSDRSPDYTGKVEMSDGEEMQLSAWLEESKSGKKYLSLQLSVHEEEDNWKEPAKKRERSRPIEDDDIPF